MNQEELQEFDRKWRQLEFDRRLLMEQIKGPTWAEKALALTILVALGGIFYACLWIWG